MRQNDGVCFSVGQIKGSTQGMTKLMVQRHAHMAQHSSTQPRTVKRITSCIHIRRITANTRQCTTHGRNTFCSKQIHDGVAIVGIQTFSCMRNGIDTTGNAKWDRQTYR